MTDTALPIAVDFIAEREGFRSAPYLDSAGNASIGYGFTYLADGSRVTIHTPHMSQPVAEMQLATMVAGALKHVRLLVTAPITDHAAAALCSFCYNIGANALKTSTLLRLLNAAT
ncbi:lysozyme [Rhodopila sp.]|uniref:lysozyme n=1 Tax=Rhodopila sp. TaxID=2480087 RepID=UPI003D1294CE